ncbi:MAG TPA: translation elongation factor 4 [Candidatus Paceibacterota bacterium]
MKNIRNFCIIAHIDHGKSTLADRMLELTGTIEKRKMREQFLDKMDLERERGITIKMQPVRMNYKLGTTNYQLNLIDTPGHIDFQYEVSRALMAVEGAILLVDATKGVQAQTLANLELARKNKLTVIPVVNKIDIAGARVEESTEELIELLNVEKKDIFFVSGKTGEGVEMLLNAIVEKIPAPQSAFVGTKSASVCALIFDSFYSSHKGALAHVRVFDGGIRAGDTVNLFHKKIKFKPIEVGIFSPDLLKTEALLSGEIGYIATNLKDPSMVRVGDTIGENPLSGYEEPKPMVWASIFPEHSDDFPKLYDALLKLKLNDAALSFEVEGSRIFGRALRAGFLGLLHLDITIERITREFGINVVVASPSVEYEVISGDGTRKIVRNTEMFSESGKVKEIQEPWFSVHILERTEDISSTLDLIQKNKGELLETKTMPSARVMLRCVIPLRKLVSNFFDNLKSVTQGYASMSYEFKENRPSDIVKLDVFVAEEEVLQFAKLISRDEIEFEARRTVDKLHEILPRQLFALKIQAGSEGKIIASRTLSAVGKNVTAKLYGGDRTRKMKLWKKQKEGKKRLQEHASVDIPHDVYLKMIKRD